MGTLHYLQSFFISICVLVSFRVTSHQSTCFQSKKRKHIYQAVSSQTEMFDSISISQSIVGSNFRSWIYESMPTKQIAITPPKTNMSSQKTYIFNAKIHLHLQLFFPAIHVICQFSGRQYLFILQNLVEMIKTI